MLYINSFKELELFFKLEDFEDRLFVFSSLKALNNQASNILPFLKVINIESIKDFILLIIGRGYGSVDALINLLLESPDLVNSMSSFSRLLYENGIIGLTLFIYMHNNIIAKSIFKKDSSKFDVRMFKILSLFILCCFMAHRRQEYFLYLGLVKLYLHQDETEEVNTSSEIG